MLQIIEKNFDELVEAIIAEKKELDSRKLAQGWHTEVRIYKDGSIDTSGLLSQNSWTQGDHYTVATVTVWNSLEDFDLLTEVKTHERYPEICAAWTAHEAEEYGTTPEGVEFTGGDFYDFITSEFEDVVETLEEEYRAWVHEDENGWMRDEAEEKVKAAIQQLEEEIAHEEADREWR